MTPASYFFSGPEGKAGKNLDTDTVNFSYLRAMNLQLANTAGDGVCADCSEITWQCTGSGKEAVWEKEIILTG